VNKKEHFIANQDGIKTFVLELSPNCEITGPPIFCIHGLTRNHKDFEPIFDDLLQLGRKIYAIDVRGRGLSDYDTNPANYNPAVYMGDVANIMAQLNIENAVFIGTSMGGIISMLMAAFMPDKVAALILNDVGPQVNEEGIARIRQYVGNTNPAKYWNEAIEKVKSIAANAYPTKNDDFDFWNDFARRVCKETKDGIILDYDPAIKTNVQNVKEGEATPDLWPQFAMIKNIPIAIIRGELSDILTDDIILKMQALKPHLKVAIINNIGHAPILNEDNSLMIINEIIKTTDF
jgi:pimeloyl-ACP methyl ester carboxylesterase